jgi:hypothetical protein
MHGLPSPLDALLAAHIVCHYLQILCLTPNLLLALSNFEFATQLLFSAEMLTANYHRAFTLCR